MKLVDLFEMRSQEQVHHNPSVATLKALARNNKYHSARFVITKDGDVVAGDSEYHTHFSMAPYDGAWDVRGYVQYMGDGEYAYRSMAVYSALNKDHPIFRIWERSGIQNGNPDQNDLKEYLNGQSGPVAIPPRSPLFMPYVSMQEAWSEKYKKSINCANPKGFSQRAHCAARRKRASGGKTQSKPVNESVQPITYDAWIRYTPESLHADWTEYVHKQDAKWCARARAIGARWPLFTNMYDFKQALDQAEIVNVDDLGDVGNMTHNNSLADIKVMVGGYQNPRDVDRIVAGLHAQVPLPLPIILKGEQGMWIQAGNTRQATARVLGIEPKALLVDVTEQP
jgi:hypothetical protein